MGQISLARLPKTCCAVRHRPCQVLEPAVPAERPLLPEEDERSETSLASVSTEPGPRQVLWVLPNARCPEAGVRPEAPLGAFFGTEGLAAPQLPPGQVRWYAVWHIPGIGRWRIAGVHWGISNTGYAAILHLHRGICEGIIFRRCGSCEEAAEVFRSRASQFDLDESLGTRVIGWSFTYDLESRQPGLYPAGRQL